jgi:hypothetical protein
VKRPVRVDSLFSPLISGKEPHMIRLILLRALIDLVYGLDHLALAWVSLSPWILDRAVTW